MGKPVKHGGVHGRQGQPPKANGFNNKVSKKFHENGEKSANGGEEKKPAFNGQKKDRKKLQPIVKHKEDMKWFEYQVNETAVDPAKDTFKDEKSKTIFDEADLLLRTDFDRYSQTTRAAGGSEASWLLNVVKKGTASDRMTAMQLQIHNSPIHSLPYVESMVASLEKKSTREAMEVIPVLEEIFCNHYLPVNRKLVSFSSRPLAKLPQLSSNSQDGRSRILVLWMFEHKLKMLYTRFLKGIESVASGVVDDLAKRSLKCALNLLAERPEGEQLLLTLLVNKLGHPNRSVGAYAANLLEELTRRQSAMKAVIVKEVERLVYRKNVSEQAHLYAATFLSQIALNTGEDTLATQLLSIYFGLFKTVVSRRSPNTKLLPILLAAANRAFPFAKSKAEVLEEDITALYKVVNTGSFPVALQTLKFLYQVHTLSDSLSDRFYSALYRKLEDSVPTTSFNQLMLLLFKALKTDTSEKRVRAFTKRLLQIASGAPPPLAAGILILVSRLWEERPSVLIIKRGVDKVAKAAVLLDGDDEDEHFVDVGLDGKPITKVEVKKDEEITEFIKDENGDEEEKKPLAGTLSGAAKDGWVHKMAKSSRDPYDSSARNPLFVDCSQLVDAELLLLAKHYHPSVAVFAQQMLEGKTLNYRGDPLEDFTLMTFLDRFAYRNPKDKKKPTKQSAKVIKKKAYDPWGVKKLAVTSKEYLEKKESELPPDERYLHRFAQLKFKVKEEKETENEDEWEFESVGSAEFDELIDRFEPGEANEEFDVDFSQEFSSEKQRKKGGDKRKVESDGEDDELSDYEGEDDEDDEDDEGAEGDDDEEEDDDDVEEDDDFEDDDEEERAFSRGGKASAKYEESDDDEDFGDQDFDVAADRFGAMLEDMDEEDKERAKTTKKHKTRKPKGFKKQRR